jgi:hypothetical protein
VQLTAAYQSGESHPSQSASAFPCHYLPGAARQYVEEAAASLGAPVAMVALPLLVAAGATIGRHRSFRLKPGFEQLPVLFGGVVAPPGSGKSPALSAALAPLRHLQHQATETYRRELDHHEQAEDDGRPRARRPHLEHFLSSDPTVEAIAPMLTSSPGLLVYYDELSSWVLNCNAYRSGRGADRQFWLSAWSSSPIKIDRKGSDSIYVAHPACSVIGGIQPDVLSKLHDPSGARDGFVERLLLVQPHTSPSPWTTATISDQATEAMIRLFSALRRPIPCGVVTPAPTALSTWADWYDETQQQIPQVQGLQAGYLSKLPVHVARLALILHALDDPDGQRPHLQATTMEGAIALGDYFLEQFLTVLPLITGSSKAAEPPLKARILNALRDGQLWNRTDLHRTLSGAVRSSALTDALNELAAEGLVHKEATLSTGGRPAEYWQGSSITAASGEDGERDEEEAWIC